MLKQSVTVVTTMNVGVCCRVTEGVGGCPPGILFFGPGTCGSVTLLLPFATILIGDPNLGTLLSRAKVVNSESGLLKSSTRTLPKVPVILTTDCGVPS